MSQWTHVAGMVRIDTPIGLLLPGDPARLLKEAFEPAPEGSEGPIDFYAVETRRHNSIEWGYLAFRGDLRDIGSDDDVKAIEQWFAKAIAKLKDMKIHVRQLVCSIEVEYGKTLVKWNGGLSEDGLTIISTREEPFKTPDAEASTPEPTPEEKP